MNRKRQRKINELEFTFKARNSSCVQIIRDRAKDHRINVFQKGHSKHRLYFICPQEKWHRFCHEIRNLCIIEPPVKCPIWLKNTILRNMRKAAVDRFNPRRAQRISYLLATLNVESTAIPSHTEVKPTNEGAFVDSKTHVKQAPQTLVARVRQIASAIFHNIDRMWGLILGIAAAYASMMRQICSAPRRLFSLREHRFRNKTSANTGNQSSLRLDGRFD